MVPYFYLPKNLLSTILTKTIMIAFNFILITSKSHFIRLIEKLCYLYTIQKSKT